MFIRFDRWLLIRLVRRPLIRFRLFIRFLIRLFIRLVRWFFISLIGRSDRRLFRLRCFFRLQCQDSLGKTVGIMDLDGIGSFRKCIDILGLQCNDSRAGCCRIVVFGKLGVIDRYAYEFVKVPVGFDRDAVILPFGKGLVRAFEDLICNLIDRRNRSEG